MFKCSKKCGHISKSLPGLGLHQRKCNIWYVEGGARSHRCQERAAAASLKRAILKSKIKGKKHFTVGTAGSSTGPIPEPIDNPMDIDLEDHFETPPIPKNLNRSPSPVPLTVTGRPRQNYELPRQYQDTLPEPPVIIEPPQAKIRTLPQILLIVCDRLITSLNAFEIWRDYPH
ncbi:hypothetical protein BDZ94DRAFT_825941 [Collybia nuda]|uniref:Uncharacterized protein n=1 Tax=Collybia nuda TaxID=64659 RepID=A0A9P5Y4T1_9AGAR|nr:hypothetical protein BDZ94DRAFT_825941 [Collybia nuda]